MPRPNHVATVITHENDRVPRRIHLTVDRLTIARVQVHFQANQDELVLDSLARCIRRFTHHEHMGCVRGPQLACKKEDDQRSERSASVLYEPFG